MSAPPPALLRRAGAADALPISVVHVRSWQWAYRDLLPAAALDSLSAEEREPMWREALLPSSAHRIWVAEREGETVGFAAWGPARDADVAPGTLELYALYLVPEVAGAGVGRALLERVLEEMRVEGCAAAALWVLEANARARHFYERGGWTPDGARKTVRLRGTRLEAVRYARRP